MSGNESHGVKNAKLKLTVIGGTILLRNNAVDTHGGRRNNLYFRFALET